jgi:hypothetical protein
LLRREDGRLALLKELQLPEPSELRTAVHMIVICAKIDEFQQASILPINSDA